MRALATRAADVLARAQATFDARLEKATTAKLARIDTVAVAVAGALAQEIEARFAQAERDDSPPYPDVHGGVRGMLITLDAFLAADADRVRARATRDEWQQIVLRIGAQFLALGYTVVPRDEPGEHAAFFVRDVDCTL